MNDIIDFLVISTFLGVPVLIFGFWFYSEVSNKNIYVRILAGIATIYIVAYYTSGYQQKQYYAQIKHYKNLVEKNRVLNNESERKTESVQ